jgi:hypothetical protein
MDNLWLDEQDASRLGWQGFRPLAARGLTYDEACAQAKTQLAAMGGTWWNTVTCDRIKQELIAQPSLFQCPHDVRCALIPSGAGACTAAQCNTACQPPPGGCSQGLRWNQATCSCVADSCQPPAGGCPAGTSWVLAQCACVTNGGPGGTDNTLLYIGLAAVAVVGILLATGGGGGGPKTLYAKPA